jgi:hypothetical protein
MAEIVLSSDDLVVLSGPSEISVDVDFGPTGARGSRIYAGYGNPNSTSTSLPNDIKTYDTWINLRTSPAADYLKMYQLIDAPGQDPWIELVKLIPNQYSNSALRNFADGVAQINIPVTNILTPELINNINDANANVFNVQYSISNLNPIASAISIGEVVALNNIFTLPITIKATEYVSNEWADLSGDLMVHLFITVV